MSELPPLRPEDFGEFFQAIHGTASFPWQARLLGRVAADGWPAVLDLPTGTGKTAAIDVAVFHLALEAGAAVRRAPLRIVYVVDRRTIVDQAYERAKAIAKAVGDAEGGVLAAVKARLAAFGEAKTPLKTVLLRGAVAKDDQWAKSASQPLVAVSTVDQVGSRLLFRGYGVSDVMKPIHAGLLGNDVLYLLDEVHLSQPFQETLRAVGDRYRGWAESGTAVPFATVEMSATPGAAAGEVFGLGPDDREHPVLMRRLGAKKPVTRLEEVKASGFIATCDAAIDELFGGDVRALGVVVNRVQAARALHEKVSARLKGKADVVLVTGRMRPLDRDRLEKALVPRIASGRPRGSVDKPIVVVATQCIEAGADFDFDALVTECASLDALRQRFGRLDRIGAFGAARAIVVARADALKEDPVYGTAYRATWEWLKTQTSLDFGISSLKVPEAEALKELLAPKANAPVLLPAHLDAWVQTSPRPEIEPDVALFLHGPNRGLADVQVVWRADLDAVDLTEVDPALDYDGVPAEQVAARRVARAVSVVQLVAPSSAEAMPVPFAAVRRWLLGLGEPEIADVEGSEDTEDAWKEARVRDVEWRAVRWRGEDSVIIEAKELKPGDTIVVPASYGGIEAGTWSPESTSAVSDLGDGAAFTQRGRAVARLHPGVLGIDGPKLPAIEDTEVDDREVVAAWIAENVERVGDDERRVLEALAKELGSKRPPEIDRVGDGTQWYVVTGRAKHAADGVEVTTEDDRSSFTGVERTLRSHMRGVGDIARTIGERIGVGAALASDVDLAGSWHDVGKADPRFQRMLHGGNEVRALAAREPLAKSAVLMRTPAARERAREKAGYPKGQRHELTSLAMLEGANAVAGAARDWELVLHLVASHHGRCRPLAPWVRDEGGAARYEADGVELSCEGHTLARLDSGVPERFWRLVRRYGWWGLAFYEAILRLADHQRSEREQRGDV